MPTNQFIEVKFVHRNFFFLFKLNTLQKLTKTFPVIYADVTDFLFDLSLAKKVSPATKLNSADFMNIFGNIKLR